MKSGRVWVCLLGALLLVAMSASASTIDYLSAGASWRYICANPSTSSGQSCDFQSGAVTSPGTQTGGPAGWQNSGFNDSGWFLGNAPFSNVNTGDFAANTGWQVGYDPFLRTTFNLTTPINLNWYLGVDNGYALYINGTLVSSGNAEGFTSRWEYSGTIPSNLLFSGNNTVAVRLFDHGGATAFDMKITGDSAGQNRVPEPGTLGLMGTGLAALWLRRKRK